MIKKVVVVFVVIGLLLSIMYYLMGYPFILTTSKVDETHLSYDSSIFNPLSRFDFKEGEWSMYLIIDKTDFDKLTPELKPYKLWKANSTFTFEQMQKVWNFKSTGGDMTTVGSSVIIVHDGRIVFESGIVLEKDAIGLQSGDFGWAEPIAKEEFVQSLKGFTKVYSPFVFL